MNGRLPFLLTLGLACLLAACTPPKKPVTPYSAAMEHKERGEITQYRRALMRELKLHPDNLNARYDLAVLMENSGHDKDAMQLYEENLHRGRHFPSAINLALLLRQQGHIAQAEQLLLHTAKHFRHEATPWYLLAEISQQRHNMTEARQRFAHAISADPYNGYAHLYHAVFLADQKEFDLAKREGRRALHLLPDCAPCWRKLGDLLRKSDDNNDALTAYQRSLAIQPNNKTRQKLINTLQALGYHKRARLMQEALNAWRQSHPD